MNVKGRLRSFVALLGLAVLAATPVHGAGPEPSPMRKPRTP